MKHRTFSTGKVLDLLEEAYHYGSIDQRDSVDLTPSETARWMLGIPSYGFTKDGSKVKKTN